MIILDDELKWTGGETAIAFGTFDGVHLGHWELIQEARRLAGESGGASMVYTYSTHPMQAFAPDRVPPQLETLEEKVHSIEMTGVEVAVIRPFSRAYGSQTPEEFMHGICAALHPRYVIIGYNYSFGIRGSGSAETMIRLGEEFGFRTHVIGEVRIHGEAVSSTRIRHAIQNGQIRLANELLGRPYMIHGCAVHGRHLGTSLGFATANLPMPSGKVIPAEGVYAGQVGFRNRIAPAVINVGSHPTVPGRPVIEAHLLDYGGEALYDELLEVRFIDRIREERRFESLEALKTQIRADCITARDILDFGAKVR